MSGTKDESSKSIKRFQLTFTLLTADGKSINIFEKLESHSMIELLSRFNLLVARAMNQLMEEAIEEMKRAWNDDIPF